MEYFNSILRDISKIWPKKGRYLHVVYINKAKEKFAYLIYNSCGICQKYIFRAHKTLISMLSLGI